MCEEFLEKSEAIGADDEAEEGGEVKEKVVNSERGSLRVADGGEDVKKVIYKATDKNSNDSEESNKER